MSTALAIEHTQIVKTNDLNSVLLEGEIISFYPPLEEDPANVTQVVLSSRRYDQTDGRKHVTSFVRINIECLSSFRRKDLHVGRRIRVVGRLYMSHRKPGYVIAEHIEVKPIPSRSR